MNTEPRYRRLALWKKMLFGTTVCLSFFALLELILWTLGVTTLIEQEDPFRGFSGLVTVFEPDNEVYRTRRATVEHTFNDQTFVADKRRNGLRIFCLGGSSSFGFPWGAEVAFTSILGEVLAANHPELHVEAVNASGISYAMHRLNIVADELLAYEPDVLIVYSGHNEFVEPSFFDALKHRSTVRTRWEYMLAHSRVYSGMRTAYEHLGEDKTSGDEQFEARVRREVTHVFDAQRKQTIVAEYRERLERLVRRAHAAGVKVLLATVPCNLRHWAPEASIMASTMSEQDGRTWAEDLRLGRERLERSEFQAALDPLERAARLAPGHAETQFLLANAYDGLQRWDAARQTYQRACDADAAPSRRVAGINEAIREVGREHGVLLVDIDRIFEKHSEHGLVGLNLVEDYVHPTREGHELIAWHLWEAMEGAGWFAQNSSADRSLFDRITAKKRRQPMTTNAGWFYNQGILLTKQGRREEAIEKYRQALEITPQYPSAMLNLGGLLMQIGQHAEAAGVLERLVEIDPDSALAHSNLGNALQRLGRSEEAVAQFEEALRIKPDDAEFHYNQAATLHGLDRFEEAEAHYEEALRIRPEFAKAHKSMGDVMQRLGRSEEAVQHYGKALELQPDLARAHTSLGKVLMQLKRIEEALRHFEDAVRLNPESVDAHNDLGRALSNVGRFEEAVSHYRAALQLNPDFAGAHNNWGNALLGLKRLDEAVEHYKDALRLEPEHAEARNNLGITLQILDRHEEAIPHHQAAVRLKPDYADFHYNLGVALGKQQRFAEAVTHLQQAVRLKPDYAAARDKLGRASEMLEQNAAQPEP